MYNLFLLTMCFTPLLILLNIFSQNTAIVNLIVLFETLWLTIFTSISLLSVFIDNPTSLAVGLFILFLTAVEGVIFYMYFLLN